MNESRMPPMAPLAPIVDQMQHLAVEHLPAPRTCKVNLWDDGTIRVMIYHSSGLDERQVIRYERTTGEITWEQAKDAGWETTELSGGETIKEPRIDKQEIRVLTTVEPPYRE